MRLFPKEENFFELFEELADKIEEGGNLFLEMAQARDYSDVRVAKLKEIEHEADNITHKTYERMHKTFLMPLDREDITRLLTTWTVLLTALNPPLSLLIFIKSNISISASSYLFFRK